MSGTASMKGKIQKPKRTPTLKQRLKRESKVVKVNDLAWKEVEIPENLGDYSGFFGLEEIDGVDVKMLNGKPEFIVKETEEKKDNSKKENKKKNNKKNDKKKKEKETKKAEIKDPEIEQDEENEKINEESDSDIDDEEFTGFEDDLEDETTVSSATSSVNGGLISNTFSNVSLPDEINLPDWQIEVSPYILHGLASLDFKTPTPIQSETIPLALQGKDVIGKASTGSGKTLAYGIPIIEKYLNNVSENITRPAGIVFAPTRELAHQVVDHLNNVVKYSPLPNHAIVNITGGLSIQKQQRLLKFNPGIIVATPGRFLELIESDEDLIKKFASTDILVLDEADRLLQDGHFQEFEKILELLQKHRSKKDFGWKWQTLVFSATFARDLFSKLDKFGKKTTGSDNEAILKLLTDKLKFKDSKPALVDANPLEMVSSKVVEALVECGPTERDLYLYYFLLMFSGSTLVFANSIDSVKRLVPFLTNLNIPTFAIHSSMIQKQRLRSIERFKDATTKNKTAVLIASDVAARGLDIPNIDHVAHYHLPRTADVYIHRSGRTARAGKEGVSVMFCSPQEASGPLKRLRKLVAKSKNTNYHEDVPLLPIETDLVSQIKDRVKLSATLADGSVSGIATKKEDSWVKQAAQDLEVSDYEDFEDDYLKRDRKRKEGKTLTKDNTKQMRYQLRQLMQQPLRKNHRRSYITSGLENLAHQVVSGKTNKEILGQKDSKALDLLRKKSPKNQKSQKSQKSQKNQKKNKVHKK